MRPCLDGFKCQFWPNNLDGWKQFNHISYVESLNLIWIHSSRVPPHMADGTTGHDMPFRDQGTGEAGKDLLPGFRNQCIAWSSLMGEALPCEVPFCLIEMHCNRLMPGKKSNVLDRKWLPVGTGAPCRYVLFACVLTFDFSRTKDAFIGL